MTEIRGDGPASDMLDHPDLELITDYVSHQLDPERVAEVRRRLEEDPAFRDLAAPLIAAWEIPPRWQLEPMPPAELQRHWEDFTRRAKFPHRERSRRRRWVIVAVSVAVIGAALWASGAAIRDAYVQRRDYVNVPNTGAWTRLRDSSEVLLAPGATLLSSRRPQGENRTQHVKLAGGARFRIQPPDQTDGFSPPKMRWFAITAGGVNVFTGRGEFEITQLGDTTELHVLRAEKPAYIGFILVPTVVYVDDGSARDSFSLHDGERARWYPGSKPRKLP